MSIKKSYLIELDQETKNTIRIGQLTVYLRLLNIAVPGLYGPSADEAMPI